MTGILVLVIVVTFFVVTIVRYQRRKASFYHEKIKAQFYFLDKERERIAFDLHDDVGATLFSLKLKLQCVTSTDKKDMAIIEDSEAQLDGVIQRLRHISFNMMPSVLQRQGLDKALKELIDMMTYSKNIVVTYRCDIPSFAQEKDIHIYRIVQEIMNNILKHAQATAVDFSLSGNQREALLHIRDNGIGFNKYRATKNPVGLGLHNISARADLLGAKVFLTTGQQKGVDYLIEIPM
ncbi:MAG: histidine kinase [Ginsengibacter sp.]